jgi:hypothetical protein
MKQIRRIFYECAYFWKVSPLELEKSPFSDVLELLQERNRIVEEMNDQQRKYGRR